MAKAAVLTSFLVLAVFAAMPPAGALIPYSPRSIWDVILPPEDPFRILEQSPLTIPKAVESVALARADWKETTTEHLISLDIPGIKKDDVKIEVDQENRVLKISGERKSEEEVEGDTWTWHRVERSVGKFWRQFRMPANADWGMIRASLENGVLRIVVPKLAGEKKKEPRVISIEEVTGGDAGSVDVKAKKDEM